MRLRRPQPAAPREPRTKSRNFFLLPGVYFTAEFSVNDEAPSDANLVAAALAGDKGAFGDLVLRYQDRLFNSLFHIVGSHEDAADVVQDALVQAFVKLKSFRGASKFYTWLYRIAFNIAISQKRRHRPTVSLDGAKAGTGDEPLSAGQSPEDEISSGEDIEKVQEALADLADDHRTIITLREIDGFAYEEIADFLDLPVGTVRSRLFRARKELKDRLKDPWGEEVDAVN
jgi:RNA polymerase sigma-70 factor (ECF subfamily)